MKTPARSQPPAKRGTGTTGNDAAEAAPGVAAPAPAAKTPAARKTPPKAEPAAAAPPAATPPPVAKAAGTRPAAKTSAKAAPATGAAPEAAEPAGDAPFPEAEAEAGPVEGMAEAALAAPLPPGLSYDALMGKGARAFPLAAAGLSSAEPAAVEDEEEDEPPPVRRPMPKVRPGEFKAGDHVVYPTHGVGQVQGIETMEAAGHSLKVIVVTFEENRMTLRVPIGKAASSGLRKLALPEAMAEALETLRGRARIRRTMWSRRAQEYEAKINSGDPVQIAEVVRDLHRNAGQPDQSFSERQIYEQAMERLASELAAIDRSDKPAAAEKLLTFLKTAG